MSFHWLASRSVAPTETRMGKALRIMPAPSHKFGVRPTLPCQRAANPSGGTSRAGTAMFARLRAGRNTRIPGRSVTQRRLVREMAEQSATGRTVLIAGAANLFVGAIKLIAGILVGSSAMLA